MQCPNCKFWNEDGSLFCEECGNELVKGAAEALAEPIAPILVPPKQAPPVPSAPFSGARLMLPSTGSIFKLGDSTLIGRANPNAQIDFEGYPDGKYVSGVHAQLTKVNGKYYLEDLGSANHSWVNGVKLMKGQAQVLNEGDSLRIGKIEMTFHEV